MDVDKIKEIKGMIRRHQNTIQPPPRVVPTGAGRPSDDLSKVMTNDIIGKGGESDLRK